MGAYLPVALTAGFGALVAAYYLLATWLTKSSADRRAGVEALGPLMELATDPRPEARPDASSSGDRAAAETPTGGPAAAPKTQP